MKILNDILQKVEIQQFEGSADKTVSAVNFDSRNVCENSLFVAVSGTQTDGHNYIAQAIANGANTIVCEKMPTQIFETITYIKVENSAKALALIAANFFQNPSQTINLVGVTGTNGKTTTATLLYRLFKNLGFKVGLISTIEYLIDNEVVKASHTTPDAVTLNNLLAQMVAAGCEYCFMEVSSHAIMQQRIEGLYFTGAIFTNITHDHLDFHKTFKDYILAKKAFFDNLPQTAFAITNIDDRNGEVMLQNTKAKKFSYAMKNFADFRVKLIETHFDSTLLTLDGKELWTQLVGEFNAYNLLAVYAAAVCLKQKPDEVLVHLSSLKPVKGRFDTLKLGNITTIVDYAHSPDALLNIMEAITKLRTRNEQFITVVGAGGNRDSEKRPLMANICAQYADLLILTSDNPRNEDPEMIISQMLVGVELQYKRKVMCITDRSQAIRAACMHAKAGDIILVAGKGHENYQEIKGTRKHFDDKELLLDNLKQLLQ